MSASTMEGSRWEPGWDLHCSVFVHYLQRDRSDGRGERAVDPVHCDGLSANEARDLLRCEIQVTRGAVEALEEGNRVL